MPELVRCSRQVSQMTFLLGSDSRAVWPTAPLSSPKKHGGQLIGLIRFIRQSSPILALSSIFSVASFAQTTAYFPVVVSPAQVSATGFSIISPGVAATVTFKSFCSEDVTNPTSSCVLGEETGSATYSVAARAQLTKSYSDLFPSNADGGWVQITSSVSNLIVFEMLGDGVRKMDSVAGALLGSNQILPLFGTASDIHIANPGNSPISVTIRFFGDAGSEVGPAVVRTIPAHVAYHEILVDQEHAIGAVYGTASYVRATSSNAFAATIITGNVLPDTETNQKSWSFANGVVLPTSVGAGLILPHVISGATGAVQYRTSITVINAASVARTVSLTLTLHRSDGSTVSVSRTLPPNGALRESVSDLFGLSGEFEDAWVQVSASGDITGFAAAEETTLGSLTIAGPLRGFSVGLMLPIMADSDPWWTGITFLNTSQTSNINVEVFVINEDGSLFAGANEVPTASFSVARGSQVSKLLSELIPQTEARHSQGGFIFIRSSSPISAIQMIGRHDGAGWGTAAAVSAVSGFSPPAFIRRDLTTVNLPTTSIVWDASRNRLLAGIGPSGAHANSIVSIDPESAQIQDLVKLNETPGESALSNDGSFLYVAINSLNVVRRFRLSDGAMDLEINTDGYSNLSNPLRGIVALPGSTNSFIVASRSGMAVFDENRRRPGTSTQGVDAIYRRLDGTLFGYIDTRVFSINVTDAGVSVSPMSRAFPFDSETASFGERLAADTSGYLFDLEQRTPIGKIALPPDVHRCQPFIHGGIVAAIYEERGRRSTQFRLVRYSSTQFQPTADIVLGDVGFVGRTIVGAISWGTDGIAVRTETTVFLTKEAFLSGRPVAVPNVTLDGGALRLNLPGGGLAYDARNRKLYASVSGHVGTYGNSVVSVDPRTGAISDPLFVGSEPTVLALTDDGRKLFVALGGAPSVSRVDLEKRRLDAPLAIGRDLGIRPNPIGYGYFWQATDIVTVPDTPDTAVAVIADVEARGIVAYDQGALLPDRILETLLETNGITLPDRIIRGGSSTEFFTWSTSIAGRIGSFDAFQLKSSPSGIKVDRRVNIAALTHFGASMAYQDGLLFGSNGTAWKRSTEALLGSALATLRSSGGNYGTPIPDIRNNRVIYVTTDRTDNVIVVVFDLSTYRPLSIGSVKGPTGAVLSAVLIDSEILAVRTAGEVILYPLQNLPPWPRPAPTVEVIGGVRKINLSVNDLAADRTRGRLVAATPGSLGEWGNSVLTINPENGSVEQAAFAGSEPNDISVTSDGRSVYTNLTGEARIGRVNMEKGERDLTFAADFNGGDTQYYVYDLATHPQNGAVAVSYYWGGMALFEEGRPLPLMDLNFDYFSVPGTYQIAFNETGEKLYAYNQYLSSFDLKRDEVGSQGIVALSSAPGLTTGFFTQIQFANGLVYTSMGDVIDAERSRRVGQFIHDLVQHGAPKRFLADTESGRVFFINGRTLLMFDMKTYALLGAMAVPTYNGEARSLVKWGPDGLAFHTSGGEIYLINISSIPLLEAPIPSVQSQLPQTSGVRLLDLEAQDLVYDPARKLLYASIPNREGALGETISAIDPNTLNIVQSIVAGPNPRRLAMSPDNRYLYASRLAWNGSEELRRLNLDGATFDTAFAGNEFSDYPFTVKDIVSIPASPGSVAVLYRSLPGENRPVNSFVLKIYDEGRQRPKSIGPDYTCGTLQPSLQPDRLYCYDTSTTSARFSRLALSSDGVSVLDSSGPDLIGEFNTGMLFFEGLLYTTNGRVIDPEQMRELGRVTANGPVTIDGNKVYWLSKVASDTVMLLAFDRATLRPAGQKAIKVAGGEPASLTPLDAGRLAFRSGKQIYIVDPF
jgi:hypothetical protein